MINWPRHPDFAALDLDTLPLKSLDVSGTGLEPFPRIPASVEKLVVNCLRPRVPIAHQTSRLPHLVELSVHECNSNLELLLNTLLLNHGNEHSEVNVDTGAHAPIKKLFLGDLHYTDRAMVQRILLNPRFVHLEDLDLPRAPCVKDELALLLPSE